jgi:adenosylmethionine-8-amino-7-oxononanoate aminotransferase
MLNYVLPYTKNSELDPTLIEKASDYHIFTSTGAKILDAQCGNINCCLGYSQESISKSIYDASVRLPFSRFNNNMGDVGGIEYTKRLADYFPNHQHFFFGSSGSDGVETAIRLNYLVTKKEKIVTFDNSYHGSTWLTTSISGLFSKASFELPKLDMNIRLPSPFGNDGEESIKALESLDSNEIACILIEPFTYLSGVKECSEEFWTQLNIWCADNNVSLILDESASGFFKTGEPFAYTKYKINPSYIVLTKSITAGYAPLSCVAISNMHWESLKDMTIIHGWTYTGNTIGIAAANAALDIYESLESNEYGVEAFLRWLQEEHEVPTVRRVGNFWAADLTGRKWRRDVGVRLDKVAIEHGIQITTTMADRTMRGLVPLNSGEDYFEELKAKLTLVLNDSRLLR